MSHKKTVVVLFNYGGGMRGLIPAYLMARLEKTTGLAMADMVDVFTGPSTGSILNAALNVPSEENPKRPKYQARHMVQFYRREGLKIFPTDRFRDFRGFIHDFNNRTMKIGQLNSLFRHGHYDPAYLSECLERLFGKHRLSDSLKSLVVPVYNIDGEQLMATEEPGENQDSPVHTRNNFIEGGGHAVWLKHMQAPLDRPHTADVSMHDAVLASTAAPTYFPCHHFNADGANITGIDGSIFDNPCISYHGAVRQHIPADANVVMILLGTGYNLRSFSKDTWNSYGGLGVVDPVNDLPLINILFHAPESALVDSFSTELGKNLHVFNKSMLDGTKNAPSDAIDDASQGNLKQMHRFANEMMEEQAGALDALCDILVANRDGDANPSQSSSFWSKLFDKG